MAKAKTYDSREADYVLETTAADVHQGELTLGEILRQLEDGSIVDNIPEQRDAGMWALKDRSLLVHTVLCGLAITPIALNQQGTGRGAVKEVRDGKQRLSTLLTYKNNEWALSSVTPPVKVRRPVMEEKLDENGDVVMIKIGRKKPIPAMVPKTDEYGNVVTEVISYKIAGKYFSQLPPKLQQSFLTYEQMKQRIYINYTPEEAQLQMIRDNTSVKMTPAQIGMVFCGKDLAERLRRFRTHDLFLNKTSWKESQIRKGGQERCVIETFVLTIPDKKSNNVSDKDPEKAWSDKYPVNVDTFREYATEQNFEAFEGLLDDFTEMLQHADSDLKEYLTYQNLPIIIAAYAQCCDSSIMEDRYDFAKFLTKWFAVIKDTTEYEVKGNSGTKKTSTVLRKLDIIAMTCKKFFAEPDYIWEDSAVNAQPLNDFADTLGTSVEDAACVLIQMDNRYDIKDFSEESIEKYITEFDNDPSIDLIDRCVEIQDKILNVGVEDVAIIDRYNLPLFIKLYNEYVPDKSSEALFVKWLKAFDDLEEPAYVEIDGKIFDDYNAVQVNQTAYDTIRAKYDILKLSLETYIGGANEGEYNGGKSGMYE